MSVEMAGTFIARLLQQLHKKEEGFDRLGDEPEVLIEARPLLIVQIDVKQLACLNRLCDNVIKIESGHLLVTDFGIYAYHFSVIQGSDKTEHRARCRQVDITARLIGFCFECKLVVITLIERVLAKEVECLAIP